MRIRTTSELQQVLDSEKAWRIKEISHINLAVKSAGAHSQSTLIRAGIPLLYAHWEGFIKITSEAYLSYVYHKRLSYDLLTDEFILIALKSKIATLSNSKSTKVNLEIVNFITSKMQGRVHFSLSSTVDTKSNLSSKVFEDIALALGINTNPYESKYKFIDQRLLDRRNHIAHGQSLDIDAKSFQEILDIVVNLLNAYKADIESAATSSQYRRADVTVPAV